MSHVRGCMVIRPWGYGIWELMQRQLDHEIRIRGHENVYFPLFVPVSYMQKEASHVEGFAKEMAVVTHHRLVSADGQLQPAGELEEPIVVRPTSETVFGESMAEWVQSYRDLPIKLNQWANVVRWEMRPRVFLRTSEFLWQEGHTAHATAQEAIDETTEMHDMYATFAKEWLALPVISGKKSPTERFPGAENTYTIEAMMQDGKALQAGTSHYLGQNFAKAAGIEFLDQNGDRQFAHTTSWGVSTRMVGAVIMTHGDDDGLRLPPMIAPHQVVIIPMVRGDETDDTVNSYAQQVADQLAGLNGPHGGPIRVHVDARSYRPSDKKWQWIKKGAPLLIEVGGRDEKGQTVSYRNRLRYHSVKQLPFEGFAETLATELQAIQDELYREAAERTEQNIRRDITDRAAAEKFFAKEQGFVMADWCGSGDCEVALKSIAVTIRCLPTDEQGKAGTCLVCGSASEQTAVWAQSY